MFSDSFWESFLELISSSCGRKSWAIRDFLWLEIQQAVRAQSGQLIPEIEGERAMLVQNEVETEVATQNLLEKIYRLLDMGFAGPASVFAEAFDEICNNRSFR